MSKISVFFGKTDALRYQKSMLAEMIKQSEKDLQGLQDFLEKKANLKRMVNDSSEVWKPLSEILMPMNNCMRPTTNVKYQQRLIEFMKAKQQAISFLIEEMTEPEVLLAHL